MANYLSSLEKQYFIKLFNKSGYVLDFSNSSFGAFCINSIGVNIQEEYGLSKGASLEAFILNGETCKVVRLLKDLIDYYPLAKISDSVRKDDECLYNKCEQILKTISITSFSQINGFSDKVNSEYIDQMQELMLSMQKSNPTEAIGKAKELIEACCKTILDELKIEYTPKDEISVLIDKVINILHLSPNDIKDTQKASNTLKQILGNLRAIATGVASLRNPYGSGHGKSASYKGLQERHAKLAIGSALTLVNFLWDSYELQKETLKRSNDEI